ncbi:hypothetical protein FNF27_01146 [Cafeteria roenbergensis]|uniref:COMM domain-containing protein n=2 Tax=Cafeteria roenbergensis TaxID=33653 RepID=A0A5A8DJ50_CAFRO|nr:hypothetical protein FNF29_00823 [Cafeteria roenbergensis]KAA0158951.1 hypothetical protein FNF31_05121 [Cafeteria roenbergensis]KAA0165159.1 hypothetical protein FNF28_03558 [Cafeteria roenbergensis]KAA0177368.1 hypothetical protein FNF27_01146 [Cafeteria roenbergensis]|eukprot:KAA0156712.1 hypothetical protein FNF29_00823 [Cafeteria roenbergensis]
MEAALLGAPLGFAGAAGLVSELQASSGTDLAVIVEAAEARLEGRPVDPPSQRVASLHQQAARFVEYVLSAARTSDATQEEAAAALSAATDLTPTAVAALAAAVGGLSKGPGPKALDRGAPAACSLQDASWRLSLAVASSTTGETALPLVHVRLVTTQQGGEQAQAVLEMTLPELRALREEVDAAIAAVDRS